MNAAEEWRAVVGYEGLYEVSSWGRVRRIAVYRNRNIGILKAAKSHGGYLFVTLSKANKRVSTKIHRIVAQAFLGMRPHKLQINHKDGCKQHNAASNLEYVTQSMNMRHAMANGLVDWSRNGMMARKLTPESVLAIRNSSEKQATLAARFGIGQSRISEILNRRTYRDVA